MSRIKICEPGKPDKWIKTIGKLDGVITFTNKRAEAFNQREGFYCESEIKTLKNPRMYDHEKYPELVYAVIDESW